MTRKSLKISLNRAKSTQNSTRRMNVRECGELIFRAPSAANFLGRFRAPFLFDCTQTERGACRDASRETATPWMTVVGEVDDVKLGSPDEETMHEVYQPVTQMVASEGVFATVGELSATYGWVVLRSRMAPEQMENTLGATVRKIDPQLPLYQVQTMEAAISQSEAPRRFNTVLISSFAIAAVLLSVLGIYGVIAFSVALREQEMAVRMALGYA